MSTSNLKVHFSSDRQDWETPQDLFDELDKEFDFEWDVCADANNTKVVGCYFDEQDDGLTQHWYRTASTCWMNPPYKTSKDWIKKASEEREKGVTTVALLPARTDTKTFHTYIYNQPNVEIRFLKGRLKFKGAKHAAPFPSMIVIFKS